LGNTSQSISPRAICAPIMPEKTGQQPFINEQQIRSTITYKDIVQHKISTPKLGNMQHTFLHSVSRRNRSARP
jgi:hypothetical protein